MSIAWGFSNELLPKVHPILSSPPSYQMATLASPLATPRLSPSGVTPPWYTPGLPGPAITRPEIRNMSCLSITGTFSKLSSASSASSSYNSTVGSLQVPSGAFKSLWEPFGALRSPREFSETFKNLQEPLVALSLALLSL